MNVKALASLASSSSAVISNIANFARTGDEDAVEIDIRSTTRTKPMAILRL